MQIDQRWEERLKRVLDSRAQESVFTDRGLFTDIPPVFHHPDFPMIESPKGRGVYVEEICPADECWYKVVTSKGRVGVVHLPAELCDDSTLENLWRRLDAKDPVRQLKAI